MALPPLQKSSLATCNQPNAAAEFPKTFRPAATKAGKYARLVEIDQHRVQRPRAHFRNALKTTEGLERVADELEMRLGKLESKEGGISFERLTAFRDAFDDVVRLSEPYCPQLNQIKNVYNEHIMLMLSQQQRTGGLYLPGPPLPPLQPMSKSKRDLDRLKKKVHQLEVESRVLLHENERLRCELSEEIARHEEEMARICEEGEEAIIRILEQTHPPKDYAARVEELQEEIVRKQMAISKEYRSRKGSVPLTVCNNLEQCLREVEIETQKDQRKNLRLREGLEVYKERLFSSLQERDLGLDSDIGSVLGLS